MTPDVKRLDAGAPAADAGQREAGAQALDLDAGAQPADPLPLLPDELPDSGFYRSYWGPQYAVAGRTVTLRGCYLKEVSP